MPEMGSDARTTLTNQSLMGLDRVSQDTARRGMIAAE
jgi:hypothetical protein